MIISLHASNAAVCGLTGASLSTQASKNSLTSLETDADSVLLSQNAKSRRCVGSSAFDPAGSRSTWSCGFRLVLSLQMEQKGSWRGQVPALVFS